MGRGRTASPMAPTGRQRRRCARGLRPLPTRFWGRCTLPIVFVTKLGDPAPELGGLARADLVGVLRDMGKQPRPVQDDAAGEELRLGRSCRLARADRRLANKLADPASAPEGHLADSGTSTQQSAGDAAVTVDARGIFEATRSTATTDRGARLRGWRSAGRLARSSNGRDRHLSRSKTYLYCSVDDDRPARRQSSNRNSMFYAERLARTPRRSDRADHGR